MSPNAAFHLRRMVLTDAKGHAELLVELDIECDACGQTQGMIHGHHVRTLYKALAMVIAEHPELCGTEGEVKETLRFQGVSDPSKARLN